MSETELKKSGYAVGPSVCAVHIGAVAVQIFETYAQVGHDVKESAYRNVLAIAVGVGSEMRHTEKPGLAVGGGEEEARHGIVYLAL